MTETTTTTTCCYDGCRATPVAEVRFVADPNGPAAGYCDRHVLIAVRAFEIAELRCACKGGSNGQGQS